MNCLSVVPRRMSFIKEKIFCDVSRFRFSLKMFNGLLEFEKLDAFHDEMSLAFTRTACKCSSRSCLGINGIKYSPADVES